jgi:predicted ATP-dependent endonuclease of OLD family
MQLKAFRVQMYKCIYDSGWVDISPLTVLIGKNESGKTSLLNGLYKLNPFIPEAYSLEKDWPRARRKERNEKQIVSTARFELTPEEVEELALLTGQKITETTLEVKRNYLGEIEVLFHQGMFPDKHQASDIDEICSTLPSIQEPVGDAFRTKAEEYLKEVRDFAYDGRFSELVKMFNAKVSELRAVASNASPPTPETKNEETFIYNYANQISVISRKLSETLSVQEKAHDYVIKHLPAFIYMSDYRVFSGSADLLQVKQNKDKDQLGEEEKTLLTIMELSGLSLEEEIEKENSPLKDQRQYDLDDASVAFTRAIAERWKQRRYEVQFRSDGHLFYTFVRDERDQSLIRLEERSKGFQWFFSFDLMFMKESRGTFKNCVILLDEPGLHLHPDAQRDLIERMNEYAKENTLLYTTHLPMMIDLDRPDSIRVLSEEDHGTIVTRDFTHCQPEEKKVLEVALGIGANGCHMVARQNLIVQSIDDFWLIFEISRLLQRSGEAGLPDDLFLTPAGSVSGAIYIASMMLSQQLEVAVLFNSDQAGLAAKEKFEREWLPRYKMSRIHLFNLGDCIGKTEGELMVEDLFPADFYLAKVEQVYKRQLAIVGCEHLNINGSGSLVKQVRDALKRFDIDFDKSLLVKAIRTDLNHMNTLDDLPVQTREMAKKLIQVLNEVFEVK